MAEAIMTAHGYIRELCELQQELIDKVGAAEDGVRGRPSDGLFDG